MSKPLIILVVAVLLIGAVGAFWFLKSREGKFPLIYNPANFVSPEETRQIEQLVRDRDERYVISINIVSTNKAGATTGDGSHQPPSGRKYELSRSEAGWRIDGVQEWKK